MKLIESSVGLVNISDPFMKIEMVGRTCYKSTSEMTRDTAKEFYKNLIARQHTAMLEHATFVFEVNKAVYESLLGHKYLNFSEEELDFYEGTRYLVSGNLRAINESGDLSLLTLLCDIDEDLVYNSVAKEALQYFPVSNEIKLVDIDSLSDIQPHAYKAHKYFTFHFICDRGVTHEMVRHRPASYAQESTRYCNYSKDKFGNEITCIKPAGYDSWRDLQKLHFELSLAQSEKQYLYLLGKGLSPQQARAVLPNALKTEIIMTANCNELDHFFNLRSKGITGAPHPDMKLVADEAYVLYLQNAKFVV